jgi:5-methylcytosine-specific restriction endonuclease McrA
MNQACLGRAKKIRELNRARQEKQAKRRAKLRAAKEAQAKVKGNGKRRSARSSGLDIPAYVRGMGPEFYLTREWRQIRYQALKLHGGKCQCCGSIETRLHVDHIKPRSKHPELELRLDNLQVLCADCNLGKGASDSTDWRNKTGAIT